MLRTLIGLFIMLHGLVHMWYFTLSQGLVEFRPEMGWSGESWFLSGYLAESTIRTLASVFFILITVLFFVGGLGVLANTGWWKILVAISSLSSLLVLVIFWDGNLEQIVTKGLIGLIINIVILVVLFISNRLTGMGQ